MFSIRITKTWNWVLILICGYSLSLIHDILFLVSLRNCPLYFPKSGSVTTLVLVIVKISHCDCIGLPVMYALLYKHSDCILVMYALQYKRVIVYYDVWSPI